MPTYAFRDERGDLVLSAPEFAAKRVEKAASAAGFETMTREDGETMIVDPLPTPWSSRRR